jgi:hypothetical protein
MIGSLGYLTNNLSLELEPIMYLVLSSIMSYTIILVIKLVSHIPCTHNANMSQMLG